MQLSGKVGLENLILLAIKLWDAGYIMNEWILREWEIPDKKYRLSTDIDYLIRYPCSIKPQMRSLDLFKNLKAKANTYADVENMYMNFKICDPRISWYLCPSGWYEYNRYTTQYREIQHK